jgi:hypothetical protein
MHGEFRDCGSFREAGTVRCVKEISRGCLSIFAENDSGSPRKQYWCCYYLSRFHYQERRINIPTVIFGCRERTSRGFTGHCFILAAMSRGEGAYGCGEQSDLLHQVVEEGNAMERHDKD